MKPKKFIASLMAAVMMVAAVPSLSAETAAAEVKKGEMRDMSTMEIVNDMGMGINLGNTFESCGDWIDQWGDGTPKAYETAWGNPVVTEEMIKGYKKAGFDTLRIPVGWSNLMSDDGKYTISKDYMKRVTEVVDWALDADLYVIVNLHWDGGWLEKVPEDFDGCLEKYEAIWKQVSANFKNYGDKLIFESQNEELGWSSVWNPYGSNKGKEESYDYVNKINQKFVDVVRASGGNNAKRHLLISGYNT
ncbi:MAG: glycoside hydrolase family 5 protein, partial [Ruminococcus sp.]|nr:glycoside hydrolase family 5 protein [Ruminococcus sp.]